MRFLLCCMGMILLLYPIFLVGKRADQDQMWNLAPDPIETETQS